MLVRRAVGAVADGHAVFGPSLAGRMLAAFAGPGDPRGCLDPWAGALCRPAFGARLSRSAGAPRERAHTREVAMESRRRVLRRLVSQERARANAAEAAAALREARRQREDVQVFMDGWTRSHPAGHVAVQASSSGSTR